LQLWIIVPTTRRVIVFSPQQRRTASQKSRLFKSGGVGARMWPYLGSVRRLSGISTVSRTDSRTDQVSRVRRVKKVSRASRVSRISRDRRISRVSRVTARRSYRMYNASESHTSAFSAPR
jgi:hypothetical protein